jgi:hypothetical protein
MQPARRAREQLESFDGACSVVVSEQREQCLDSFPRQRRAVRPRGATSVREPHATLAPVAVVIDVLDEAARDEALQLRTERGSSDAEVSREVGRPDTLGAIEVRENADLAVGQTVARAARTMLDVTGEPHLRVRPLDTADRVIAHDNGCYDRTDASSKRNIVCLDIRQQRVACCRMPRYQVARLGTGWSR